MLHIVISVWRSTVWSVTTSLAPIRADSRDVANIAYLEFSGRESMHHGAINAIPAFSAQCFILSYHENQPAG